ncbi:hypothetical protein [Actinoplanes sp. N902-109]|uniref:hypothetical protein n=1 Tax=Actinoplanes sp. (strain N902-109) TaxID=649831 RepID=UPI00032936FB|nr:hypothetical protein [Actinoplanes sp. N902-109]AGL13783.1 hypothetical protein L083_0273 [Actinoplanes sp. N902-109]
MTDDHRLLRQTLSDLAEHGGHADLYERSLRTSKRLTRNRRIVTVVAALAVVAGIGTPIAVANARRAAPPPQILVPPSVGPTVTSSPAPSPSHAPVPSGTGTPAAHSATHPAPPITTPPSSPPSSAVSHAGCPVSAKVLSAVAKSKVGEVECHGRYAIGVGANAGMVFRYDRSADTWHLVGEGSAEICQAYLPRSAWGDFELCGSADPAVACPMAQTDMQNAVAGSEFADLRDGKYFDARSCSGTRATASVGAPDPTAYFIFTWRQSSRTWKATDAGPCPSEGIEECDAP